MFSRRKVLIAVTSALAFISAPALLAIAVLARLDRLAPDEVERILPFALLPELIVVTVTVVLVTEFARLRGINWNNGELELPWAHARLMLSWCPAAFGLAML